MEIHHGFWTSSPVLAAAAGDDAGTVIRLARRRADLNQTQLGALCGYSVSTISRIERGQPPCQDIDVRRNIAGVLGIPPDLLGLASPPGLSPIAVTRVERTQTGHAGVRVVSTTGERGDPVRRREVLSGLTASAAAVALPWSETVHSTPPALADLLNAESTSVAALDPAQLGERLSAARRTFSASNYDELTARLVTLIAGAAAARRHHADRDEQAATVVLAAAYRLASELCVKRNDDALGWVLADRALTAARSTGLAGPIAHASRSAAVAMRRAGHHDDAIMLLTATAQQVQPGSAPSDIALATYGSLLCTAAYANAQAGRRPQAEALLDEAAATASRTTGPVIAGEIMFSPTNVAVYRIGAYTALGDSAAALDHARTVDVSLLASAERYARYCIDTARAWEHHGRHDRATQALQAAESRAPQELRRPSTQELITRILYAPTVTPSGLRSLATRAGAIS
ncbi:helix-turn-helix domain-containing protein [Actinoplanes couchii]|uniref:HTH cro/C1-type domain-containing protein n=1 Tax=Actinoplanes couchii TaxID=403638 RepID=A0ABQ3XSC4_9ACTN|nr:helix-turn-helix transcriptional regulator [Actinoplanes couchii]MDR6318776.1 transcriptional regulator with XRE-family HTH domain [Actinoplanes couchii]GID61305.1 hypothetical protein Aco03nite_097090 [Actinoplanes couchii]